MSRYLLILLLCLLLLSQALPVCADQYDDCMTGCKQPLDSCIEQAKLNAGNIQEQQDMITACKHTKVVCIQECKDAEAAPESQPQQAQPPREKPPVDFNGEIKTYEFK